MKQIVHVIIERASDGGYGAYTKEDFEDFLLVSLGLSPKEAIDNFLKMVEETKKDVGERFPDMEFVYQYDVASFLRQYKEEFSLSGLQQITGINQKQLQHYLSGVRKPSPETVNKIKVGIKEFASRLEQLEFA